jgi:simple sugar transport system permease protein
MSSTIDSGTPAAAPTGGPAPKRGAPRSARPLPLELIRRFLIAREGSIIVVTVLLTVYFILTLSSAFTSTANIQALFPYFAPFAILAVGEVFLMINGEIDLSIGGVYLFAPYLYYELANGHVPLLIAVIISIVACTMVGLLNGIITMFVGISSFITTLGTLFTLEGFTLIISHAQQVTAPGSQLAGAGTGSSFSSFASVFGAGTYSELIWALVIVAIMHVVLVRTRWGVHTIAVGSNRIAAAEAGVRVRLVVIRNFMVCSTFAGIVGILEAIRTSSITPDPSGAGVLTLSAIACAVIGGTLLLGGAGTVIGALFGALFLGILQDGLAIKGVNANYLDFYLGLAILLAMAINTYVGRVRRRSGVG